ncbi:MAG: response regulator transcription factor [Acidimicrobiales bacterium]
MLGASVRRVLVADDDEDIVELLRINLEAHGYEVSAVRDGQAALDSARRDPPDLVVLDWMMPVKDGMETLAELKADEKLCDLPVVMITAKATDSDVWEGWQAGADFYITKPFDLDELMRFIGFLRVNVDC